ncbi:MAG: Na+/phosphate symporter [Crocinitomicaceae bacterium]|jgi:hypothetical protein
MKYTVLLFIIAYALNAKSQTWKKENLYYEAQANYDDKEYESAYDKLVEFKEANESHLGDSPEFASKLIASIDKAEQKKLRAEEKNYREFKRKYVKKRIRRKKTVYYRHQSCPEF